MHEVAISQGLVDLIDAERRTRGFQTVRRVGLTLGAFSHVEPEALRFGFEVASRGTVAEGAELVITITPAQAWCMKCSQTATLHARGDACPTCGGHQLMLQGGEEMRLSELEVV
jgi:hydrogenase nickel incorporation protein HypA/HybF